MLTYQRGETITFTCFYGDYNAIGRTGVNARIEIYDPQAATKLVNNVAMTMATGYDGMYRYNYTIPTTFYNKDLVVSFYELSGSNRLLFQQKTIRVVNILEQSINKVDEADGIAR